MNYLLADVNIGDSLILNKSGDKLGTSYGTISPLINIIVKNSLVLAGIIFLALLVFGGIVFIASAGSGDQKQAEKGKKAITSAIIGFAIVFGAYLIIQLITAITGLEILNSGY